MDLDLLHPGARRAATATARLPNDDEARDNPHATGAVVEFAAFEVVNRHILKADRLFYPYVAAAA